MMKLKSVTDLLTDNGLLVLELLSQQKIRNLEIVGRERERERERGGHSQPQ